MRIRYDNPIVMYGQLMHTHYVYMFINIGKGKEIGHEEPYYDTKISLFSYTWAGLAVFHKSSTI